MTISTKNIFNFQYLKNLVSNVKDLKGKNLAPAIQLSYISLCDHHSKFDEFTITIKELCNMFYCEERQVFRYLNKLENSGLIKRKRNTSDKGKRKIGNSLFITLIHPDEIFKHNDMESI
jgi:DNA-binding MarR family transcriptional regulator